MPATRGDLGVRLALDALAREGDLWLRGGSQSMLPLIRPEDEIRLVPVSPARVVPGMLIAYRREERLVIHRVLACGGPGFITKGDAIAASDPPVHRDDVLARVVALRSASGRSVDFTAFPWPLLNRFLSAIATLASRPPSDARPPSLGLRLAWKTLRVPFYLARLLIP